MLQSESMSALTGIHFAKLTIKALGEMQIEESSKLFFDAIKKKSSIYTFGSEPRLPRDKRRPNYKSVVDYMQIDGHDENASN